jgi:hypothetical protein
MALTSRTPSTSLAQLGMGVRDAVITANRSAAIFGL